MVLMIKQCFSCCSAVLAKHQGLLCFSLCPLQRVGLGVGKRLARTQLGQLAQTGQRNIPILYNVMFSNKTWGAFPTRVDVAWTQAGLWSAGGTWRLITSASLTPLPLFFLPSSLTKLPLSQPTSFSLVPF